VERLKIQGMSNVRVYEIEHFEMQNSTMKYLAF